MLSLPDLWLGVGVLLTLSFPLGYLLLNIRTDAPFAAITLFRFPVFLAVGVAGYAVLLYAASFVHLSVVTVMVATVVTWSLFVVRMTRTGWRSKMGAQDIGGGFKGVMRPRNTGFLALLGVALLLFSIILVKTSVTTPPGDPVSHGTHTALLLFSQGFHPSGLVLWDQFAEVTSYYPRGFHVLGAATSILSGVFPAESILVLATAIALLIPLVAFSFVYSRTQRASLALLGGLLILLIPSGQFRVLDFEIPAVYVQGLYPFLLGLMTVLTFFMVGFANGSSASNRRVSNLLPVMAVLTIALLLSYYYLLVLVLIYLVSRLLVSSYRSSRRAFTGAMAAIAAGTTLYALFSQTIRNLAASSVLLPDSFVGTIWVSFPSFLGSPFSLLILASLALALISLWRGVEVGFALAYSIFAILMLLTTISQAFYLDYLWFMIPRRNMIPLVLLSSVILPILVWRNITSGLARGRAIVTNTDWLRKAARPGLYGAALALTLLTSISYANAPIGTWGFPQADEYEAVVWISENIDEQDLILNDRSFVGLYLPAFGIKNVVHLREFQFFPNSETPYPFPLSVLERIRDSAVVFDDPDDQVRVRAVVEKWDIKFVFVASDNVYYDYWSESRYRQRGQDVQSILRSLDQNPDFRPIFRRASTAVYATFLVPSLSLTSQPVGDEAWSALRTIGIGVQSEQYLIERRGTNEASQRE